MFMSKNFRYGFHNRKEQGPQQQKNPKPAFEFFPLGNCPMKS